MSSVFGLNARPQSAIVLPASSPSKWLLIFSNSSCFWRVVDRLDGLQQLRVVVVLAGAERTSAFTSFGKHEPP